MDSIHRLGFTEPGLSTSMLSVYFVRQLYLSGSGNSSIHKIDPDGLHAPHVVVDGSEAGHCFHLLFSLLSQAACVCHPWWRVEAFVFTDVFTQAACMHHPWWRTEAKLATEPVLTYFQYKRKYIVLLQAACACQEPNFRQGLLAPWFFCFLRPAFGRGAWTNP